MKSTVEQLSPTRVKLTVEVEFDELKTQFDQAYRTLGGQVRIPGFRPGKVPAKILDARLGRGAILTEVVNNAIPEKYSEAVNAEELKVLGQPEIDISRLEDGEALEFTAEVDIRPDITLPDFSDINVTVDDLVIEDADVDEQVEALRDRFGTVSVVKRAAQDGDVVSIDLEAAIDGTVLEDGTADNLTYRIGSGDLVDGVDEALIGLHAEESATFASALLAGEHAGKEADVTVTVRSVSERTLPAVDDDFAQLASEFDTVAELRDDLVEKVKRVKNLDRAGDARDKVLAQLLETVEIPIPENAREAEIEARQHQAVHSFDHNEEALNAHLESIGQTREELDKDIVHSAEEAVRTQLLLDAVAEANNVGVTQEEFTQRVMFNAQRFGLSPDEYFQRLQQGNQIASVFAEVRRAKALMSVVQQVTIKDLSGETLDFADLFGIEMVPTEAPAPVDPAAVVKTAVNKALAEEDSK